MKKNHLCRSFCIAGLALAAAASTSLQAATAPTLNAELTLRPLSGQEIKDYKLTGVQAASGLMNVGIGQPAYLEALINIDVPAADVTNVSWTLDSAPLASAATLADDPLGAAVPAGKMVDRGVFQVLARKLLVPDAQGEYKVSITIETASSGSATLQETIVGAKYMGLHTCELCHSGGEGAENKVGPWSQTRHATFFARAIDGTASDHYASYCISCHVLGYDTAPKAVNGGFDDVASQVGWTFPTVVTNGNWASMPAALTNVANIQCENCHGPGSEHAFSLGEPAKITVSFAAGDCAQCHDAMPHHFKNAEWNNSRHAIAVEETEAGCARCHAAKGFANFTSGKPAEEVPYDVITCAACHAGHDATNPHQLRGVAPVKLMDNKTVVTKGGLGLMCMNCHISRRDAATYVVNTAGSNRYGPHHGPQTDMFVGANGFTYGKEIPSSAHRDVVEESCVQCHMQPLESGYGFTKVGGHTFNMAWAGDGTNGPVHMTEGCVECHGEIESFDFKRQDYDGDGVVEGVQTEVKGLMAKVAYLLPPVGVEKENIAVTASWGKNTAYTRAAYNYLFVWEDGSYGVHNLAYAVGLLQASLADLTGDSNNDRLPDWWQVQYFGSANDSKAAPNATPAGDGIPNWMKYTLGLDPNVQGIVMPNGVVWANGKGLVNPPDASEDTIAIYTAAEVVFKTVAGKSYQVEAATAASGQWEKVGEAIQGDGTTKSYVSPTRTGVQMFYRVVHN